LGGESVKKVRSKLFPPSSQETLTRTRKREA
jgi:hypothetical protein